MSAPHLFARTVTGERVVVEDDDAHHAVRVLRLRAGEHVTIGDGEGNVADAVVEETAPKKLVLRVTQHRFVERETPRIVVLQGIPKTGKLDLVVQKLTELGVDAIVPLETERSVAKLHAGAKVDRLRAIAREAAKQSHRAWLPTVEDPVSVAAAPKDGLVLVLHEEASTRLHEALPPDAPDVVTVAIGPEGGFTPGEVALLQGAGGAAVSLGPQILRTETAGLVTATLVLGHYRRIG